MQLDKGGRTFTSAGDLVVKRLSEDAVLTMGATMMLMGKDAPEHISYRDYKAILEAIASGARMVVFRSGRVLSLSMIAEVNPRKRVVKRARATGEEPELKRLTHEEIEVLKARTFKRINGKTA